MKEIKVRDAMTPDPITVLPETPVTEVAGVMIDNGIGGVPVVNSEGDLLGIITESDLIVQDTDVKFPSFVHFLDGYVFVPGSIHRFEEKFRKAVAATAEDLMTVDVITVDVDDSAEDAATLMSKKKLKRFPVISEGQLVGIITMRDIVKLISKDIPVEGTE
ncbi:MAG: CBS domain-containing protein [Actinobacteria bacterium]|nr:CBS domain-containing protein [Actinomycetota bacterium]